MSLNNDIADQRAEELARAFNAGADARIAGWAEFLNPHAEDEDPGKRRAWANGWQDAAQFWGRWSKRPVQPLPRLG